MKSPAHHGSSPQTVAPTVQWAALGQNAQGGTAWIDGGTTQRKATAGYGLVVAQDAPPNTPIHDGGSTAHTSSTRPAPTRAARRVRHPDPPGRSSRGQLGDPRQRRRNPIPAIIGRRARGHRAGDRRVVRHRTTLRHHRHGQRASRSSSRRAPPSRLCSTKATLPLSRRPPRHRRQRVLGGGGTPYTITVNEAPSDETRTLEGSRARGHRRRSRRHRGCRRDGGAHRPRVGTTTAGSSRRTGRVRCTR